MAAADPSAEARAQAQAVCGIERVYADPQSLLAEEDLDGVIIATPHNRLRAACLAAIAAGRHVFVEKPMAISGREGAEIVAAARTAGVQLMVGYCLRSNAVRTAMKDLLAQDAVGDLSAVMGGKGGQLLQGWLADPRQGGGEVFFLGSHLIDQVLWLVGEPVERAYAEMTYRADTGADETTVCTLCFSSGMRAELLLSLRSGVSFDYVEVIGSAGRAWRVAEHAAARPQRRPARLSAPRGRARAECPVRPMFVAELSEFAAAIRAECPPAVTGEDGLRVLAVINAIFESARSGRPVDVRATTV